MINLDALNKQFETVEPKKSIGSKEADKFLIKSLPEGSEIAFSLVESHPHQVESGSPFIFVSEYFLKTKKTSYGQTRVLPKSSFDETLIDPIATFLANVKEMYASKNDGDNTIPKELYKTLMPRAYAYVPVVVKNQENQGVKWLKMSTKTFKSLTDLITKWYDFEAGKGADFELKRVDATSYTVSPTPGSSKRAIEVIDKGILESSLENLPALEDLLYVNSEEQVDAALQENLQLVLAEIGDESEVDYGSSKDSNQPTKEEKTDIAEKMKGLFSS